MTVGRNDPCPCGSGKKYKKCCQPQHEVISLEAVREDNLFRGAWNKFSDFMSGEAAGDVVAEGFAHFFAAPVPDEEMPGAAEMGMDWVAFAYRSADGTTLCEQFAAAGKGLTDQERDLLRSWSGSTTGFFRVEGAPGREWQLRRLPDDEVFPVQPGSIKLKAGELVYVWLLPFRSTYRLGFMVQEIGEEALDPLMHLTEVEMGLLRRQRPDATWDELFREHWPRLFDAFTMAVGGAESVLRITLPPGRPVMPHSTELAEAMPKWRAVEEQIRSAAETMEDSIGPFDIEGALRLWRDGAGLLRPRVGGANGWAAAVLYLYLRDVLADDVTQAEVAEACITSAATVSKHSRALADVLRPDLMDPRYAPLMDPVVRTYWRMYCMNAMEGDDEPPALPLPDRRIMDRALRGAARELSGEYPDAPVRQAEELIDQAWDASGSRRTRLAEQALQFWPDAADAYVILGEAAEARGDLREARRLYGAGVAAGERALGSDFFAENVGHFYGMVESRPYMRARAGLGGCLWALGEREAAVAEYEEMLRLNPGDNQGIRYLLAACYLVMGDDARLGRLLAQYAEEATAAITFTRALWQYRRSGPGKAADHVLAEAVTENPHVPAYLLGEKRLPVEPPAYIDFGGKLEAQAYAWDFEEGWKETPGALEWLRSRVR